MARSGTEPASRSGTEPAEALEVHVVLRRGAVDPVPVFRATLDARLDRARSSFLAGSLRYPFTGHRVMALIKLQGIRLWLRGLPVVPRPIAPRPNRERPVQKGVAS